MSQKNASHAPIFSQMPDERPMMEKKTKKNKIDYFNPTT